MDLGVGCGFGGPQLFGVDSEYGFGCGFWVVAVDLGVPNLSVWILGVELGVDSGCWLWTWV